MGMYTELVLGLELYNDKNVIKILKYMTTGELTIKEINDIVSLQKHPLFNTSGWKYMLMPNSYYFDGYLNVRCDLKNCDNEIEYFLDWLSPYISTNRLLGYMRFEECDYPTLIYKEKEKIILKEMTGDNIIEEELDISKI